MTRRPSGSLNKWFGLVPASLGIFGMLSCAAGEPIEGNLAPAPAVAALHLVPDVIDLPPDASTTFSATYEMVDGSTLQANPEFTANGGTITPSGVFTAGHGAGEFRVVASIAGFADTAVVTVTGQPEPNLIRLSINPGSAALLPTGTQRFNTNGIFSDSSIVPLSVDYAATGGTISSSGLYTAGQIAGLFRVIGSLKGGELADTATIEIGQAPANLVRIELTPPNATVNFGQTFQFTAGGRLSDSTLVSLPITWSATGGTVTANGFYTAGTTAGTSYRVIARASNGMADTSRIRVQAASVTSIELTPAVADLQTGQIQQFSVKATLSDGSTQNNPAVTYSATGGLMTAGGLYTAGLLPGTYSVIAQTSSGVADTSTVNISPAVLTLVNLSPTRLTVQAGQTAQFRATGILSNGGTQPDPDVQWTATGGSVSGSGLYTANVTPGTYTVRATNALSLLFGSATVTVVAAPPPNMFFNSAEPGCGSDPNVILCDDFEDGDWYAKDVDKANASGGLLQTDGWAGTIYANPITPAGAASCGDKGAAGTSCAANGGNHSGGEGGRNMADHQFSGGPVTELWARWYYKPEAGYQFGAEKHTNFTKAAGDITWFNIQFNCGAGGAKSTATPYIQIIHGPSSNCYRLNVSDISLTGGNWYFFEVHLKLNSSGTTQDGLIEIWINECGATGICTGAPTLRSRLTNVGFDRNQSGCLTSPCKVETLWFENWANPGSRGTAYLDQIKVSKAGPIGFVP